MSSLQNERSVVNLPVVEAHAGEAAFLWNQITRASKSPKYRLSDLALLDTTLAAHLRGLRVAGELGWSTCVDTLTEGLGEMFAGAALALTTRSPSRVSTILTAVRSTPELAPAISSAALRVAPPDVQTIVARLLSEEVDELVAAGMDAMTAAGLSPPPGVNRVATRASPAIRTSFARMVGSLKLFEWEPYCKDLLRSSSHAPVRAWSAWALVMLGRRSDDVLQTLLALTAEEHPVHLLAADLLGRLLSPAAALATYRSLRDRPSTEVASLALAAASGSPQLIDEIVISMQEERLAAWASHAFAQATNVDLERCDLDSDGEPDDDLELPAADAAMPDPERVAQHWCARRSDHGSAPRLLAGEPLCDERLERTFRTGRQPQRAAAALELALRHRDQPLRSLELPAMRQAKELLGWS